MAEQVRMFVHEQMIHTPVFVKSALALIAEMLSKDGFERTQAVDGLDVSHNPDYDDWRSFDDGHRLHFLSLWLLWGQNREKPSSASILRLTHFKILHFKIRY